MYQYAGIDVSLEYSSVCLVDGTGKMLREAKVASEPEALIAWFRSQGLMLERIGLEAGPLSQWLYAALREALYQAAHVMLTKPVRNCSALKSWAMRIARRAGMRKAKVALARKLAIILHRMLADAKPFNPMAKAAAT